MHVGEMDVVQAGEPLTIDLSAIKVSGFTYDHSISCTNANGVPIEDIKGITYPETAAISGLTLHLQVTIGNVNLSHAGLYVCTAFLETPPQLDNISDSANATIKVKSKSEII